MNELLQIHGKCIGKSVVVDIIGKFVMSFLCEMVGIPEDVIGLDGANLGRRQARNLGIQVSETATSLSNLFKS